MDMIGNKWSIYYQINSEKNYHSPQIRNNMLKKMWIPNSEDQSTISKIQSDSLSFRLPLNLKYHFNKTIESYWNHKIVKPGSIIDIDVWSINRRIEGIGYDYRIGLNHSIANGIKLRWPPILETIIRKRRPNLLIWIIPPPIPLPLSFESCSITYVVGIVISTAIRRLPSAPCK
ncbi:hypothetical protein DERP_013010 [Dermatophagoides pteronyssinus]|uniref:Uncharacterized protein n=1 Tax=Dermatophagoides pteronyssinus TaxID=6956 RepID=A0ABQ8JPT9_DERPT|nr:hypothetical protein DERP_013010 [Dermatophagoides pteronyssinus]